MVATRSVVLLLPFWFSFSLAVRQAYNANLHVDDTESDVAGTSIVNNGTVHKDLHREAMEDTRKPGYEAQDTASKKETDTQCTAAAQRQLQVLEEIMGASKQVVAKCEGATENCISKSEVNKLAKDASTRLMEALGEVLKKCDLGSIDLSIAYKAKRLMDGEMGIMPGTAASTIKEIAPDMTGLKSVMQEAGATEPDTSVNATPTDGAAIDGVATDRINDVVSKYEKVKVRVKRRRKKRRRRKHRHERTSPTTKMRTLAESGDQMPMSLELYCNGGSATDNGWDDLDIYNLSSVTKIYQSADFKVRGGKHGRRTCDYNRFQLYSFHIDKQTEAGGDFRYTQLFESIGGGWDKFKEGEQILGKGDDNDVFNLIRCKPGEELDTRHCFKPSGPAHSYPPDFAGFRVAPRGEFGVCLSKEDPETDLKKLSCAARALAFHMKDATESSSLIQVKSDVAWVWPVKAVGSILAGVLTASAFAVELALTIVDTLVEQALAVIIWLGGLGVDIVTFPLIPLLGKNHNSKRRDFRNFITSILQIPLCVVSTLYSIVSYAMFALSYIVRKIAFFHLPGGGGRSMAGEMHQSMAGQRLNCFNRPRRRRRMHYR
eukprot:TRINITY_DN4438_c1_g6_i1.p1 TRINITY_DN4438_c1_g6~~TRINITY_DN4438_c1_g6_i1.p1  ORF type:complete len:602 (-),score=64.42 TRINITY_DN4438_c1_g6_i1:385-2190(-)